MRRTSVRKLLLVNPVAKKSGYLLSRFSTFAPLGLGYVAGMTPPSWEVRLIDENFDSFVYEEADLVAISAFTSNINRAYEIAAQYRKNGIKVIIGVPKPELLQLVNRKVQEYEGGLRYIP